MEIIVADAFFGVAGWIYLLIRYRNLKQMRSVVKEKYENQYATVGREIISNTFLLAFAALLFAGIIAAFYIAIFKN